MRSCSALALAGVSDNNRGYKKQRTRDGVMNIHLARVMLTDMGSIMAFDQSAPTQPSQSAVRVQNLGKHFGAVKVIHDISFDVKKGQTVTLLGPSGCGKTTTLRCIAGLETPSSGDIFVAGQHVFHGATQRKIEPERRNIGMVFQSYAIWPHMTVGENIQFPLDIKKMSAAEKRARVEAVLKSVGLSNIFDRPASQLSGGQQQRVALARALVFEPDVVLFDEPLSNLDANLRDHMRNELQELQSRIGFTSIYVTHDQREALSLSDEVIVMKDGHIEQAGTPRDIFSQPRTRFTAKFLGYGNIFDGHIIKRDNTTRQTSLETRDHISFDGVFDMSPEVKASGEVAIAFRSNKVRLSTDLTLREAEAQNYIGEVESAAFFGNYVEYTIRIGDQRIKADSELDRVFGIGDRLAVSIRNCDCHITAM
jgi:iron(III) transport system ATP-binding protein